MKIHRPAQIKIDQDIAVNNQKGIIGEKAFCLFNPTSGSQDLWYLRVVYPQSKLGAISQFFFNGLRMMVEIDDNLFEPPFL